MEYCGVLSGIAGYYWVLGVLYWVMKILMGVNIEYRSVLGGTAVLTNKYLGTMKDK